MIWEDEQAIIDELLYWQKRALKAEREVESELDYQEFLLEQYTSLQIQYFELEESIDKSFSDYTKKILKEEAKGFEEEDLFKYRS